MKIVINTRFGGFGINPKIRKKCGFDKSDPGCCYNHDVRTDKKLIELIESGVDCNTIYSNLAVVEIPDNATDYYIYEYDGLEDVLYVLDGKIRCL